MVYGLTFAEKSKYIAKKKQYCLPKVNFEVHSFMEGHNTYPVLVSTYYM